MEAIADRHCQLAKPAMVFGRACGFDHNSCADQCLIRLASANASHNDLHLGVPVQTSCPSGLAGFHARPVSERRRGRRGTATGSDFRSKRDSRSIRLLWRTVTAGKGHGWLQRFQASPAVVRKSGKTVPFTILWMGTYPELKTLS